MISARTKAALQAANRRDKKLGGNRGVKPGAKMQAASRKAYGSVRNVGRGIRSDVAELQASGLTSLRALATGLNDRGIPTARGSGQWSAVQVARVLERIDG